MMARFLWVLWALRPLCCAALRAGSLAALLFAASGAAAQQPNVVLILADDLGFSDLGAYGSEIATPAIDALAARGLVFSNYHTAASCAPTRGMLLTGVDSHRNGVPNIVEAIPEEQQELPTYRGALSERVVTVATLLSDAGYHTYLSGKWHLGHGPGQLPVYRGFERSVTLADTGADNWEQKPYLPIYERANWYENGERLTLPDDFYSSRYLVDRLLEFIDAGAGDGRPFFAYLPFQAVHIPVQAPREFTERYLDRYQAGWDVLREARRRGAVARGLLPEDAPMVRMATTADWGSLDAEQQRYEAKRMAVYAGMVEAMDQHVGRLVSHLEQRGLAENTVFIVTSDNGSEPSDPQLGNPLLNRLLFGLMGYSNSYETLGERGSFNSIGPSFASASASPLAYYKFFSGEGGMRVPLIIAAPEGAGQSLTHAFSWVTDLAPTILELAGLERPAGRYGDRVVERMTGRSLVPLLEGRAERVYDPETTIGYELGGNAALFQGDYKLVLNREAPGDGAWHLYNFVADPGETRDLRDADPERYQRMLNAYEGYARANGVLPVPDGYNQRRVVFVKGLKKRFGPQVLWLLLWGCYLLPFVLWWRAVRRREQRG